MTAHFYISERFDERHDYLPSGLRLGRRICVTLAYVPPTNIKARFIEPMLLLRTDRLPDDAGRWRYEIKWDGFRAVAVKTGGHVHLRSRNDKDFNKKYPVVVNALAGIPDETMIDGEIVALDQSGRPSFNTLQNLGSSPTALFYYVFDVMVLAGVDLTGEPLSIRRQSLHRFSRSWAIQFVSLPTSKPLWRRWWSRSKRTVLKVSWQNAWTAVTNPGNAPEPGRRCG